jgi:hypothetical protein
MTAAEELAAHYLVDQRDPVLIRADIRRSLLRYAQDGVPVGDFLRAVLANDLVDAAARADPGNAAALSAIAAFIVQQLPAPCWGSRRVVAAWTGWHAARRVGEREQEAAAKEELEAAHAELRRR